MRALTPPIRIAMTETTTPVMATTAPTTVPMIHFVSLLTSTNRITSGADPTTARAWPCVSDPPWSPDGPFGPVESAPRRRIQGGEGWPHDSVKPIVSACYMPSESEALEAQRLVEWRDRWLNPPEWVEWMDEPVPEALKRRTLTKPL